MLTSKKLENILKLYYNDNLSNINPWNFYTCMAPETFSRKLVVCHTKWTGNMHVSHKEIIKLQND